MTSVSGVVPAWLEWKPSGNQTGPFVDKIESLKCQEDIWQ